MQVQPFLFLCFTQDLRPSVLAAVLRPRTDERGCTLQARTHLKYNYVPTAASRVGTIAMTIPAERRDSVTPEVQHHTVQTPHRCAPCLQLGTGARNTSCLSRPFLRSPPAPLTCRLSQPRTRATGVLGTPDRGVLGTRNRAAPWRAEPLAQPGSFETRHCSSTCPNSERKEKTTTREPQLPLLAAGSVHALQAQTSEFSRPGVLSRLSSPLGFAALSSPCHPHYCLELLGNTYSAKGSSCKSSNSQPASKGSRGVLSPLDIPCYQVTSGCRPWAGPRTVQGGDVRGAP